MESSTMGYCSDYEFFIGHPRSSDDPEGYLVSETQHTKGSWIGILEITNRSMYGEYVVTQRENRHLSKVLVVQPMNNYSSKEIDADFHEWEYEFGFGNNLNAAQQYVDHLLKNNDHPSVIKSYKRNKPKDSQRQKLYDWEHQFYQKNNSVMNDNDIKRFMLNIQEDFCHINRREIILTFHERGGCYQRGLSEINIANYGRNRDVIIHEMAHWVVSNIHKRQVAGHGPEFVGVFMLMLEYYQGVCLTDMINAALKANLKFVFPEGGLKSLMEDKEILLKEAA